MDFNDELVAAIKQRAKENPHDPGSLELAPTNCLWKDVKFENELLTIMLTYEVHGNLKAWHLSIARSDQTAAPADIADHIAGVILGQNVFVLPEAYFPPNMRFMKQFVKKVDDE